MADVDRTDTKARVLSAATALFAARGYRATTVRDIAARARVNVASGHYHFGSKKTLYLEVLRRQFAAVRETLEARGGSSDATALSRLSRSALEDRFRARVQIMLDLQIGPHALPHPALLQREMSDPTEALPIIVREFMTPIIAEMAAVLRQLAPSLSEEEVEHCCLSVAGQAHFYFTVRPALLKRWGVKAYPADFTARLAEHITAFSLGGIDRVVRRRTRRGRHATH